MFYSAYGDNGFAVYSSYDRYLKNGVYLGKNRNCKKFKNESDAIKHAIVKYNEHRTSIKATMQDYKGVNNITFTKDLPIISILPFIIWKN